MKIDGGPSWMGLQHMAARAQDARKSAATVEPSAVQETVAAGNDMPVNGENLPTTSAPAASASERIYGLERAIEQLTDNASKNPQAKGLLNALEMLTRNLERSSTINTLA
jgi:hypothetical protein